MKSTPSFHLLAAVRDLIFIPGCLFNFLESIQIFSKTLIAVPMAAMVVHKSRGNIGAMFRKLARGSVRLIETFKCNLFNLFKFFILVSCLRQIDKVLFVAWGKMNDTYFIWYQENSHPENSHPSNSPLENSHLEYSHPIFPPEFLNFLFFHYCHRHHWYYLKDCFVILCFKSAEILSSSNPHIFVFLIFTFVNICQNLSF